MSDLSSENETSTPFLPHVGCARGGSETSPDAMAVDRSEKDDDTRLPWDFSSLTPLCLATRDFNRKTDPTVGVSTKNNFLKGASFSPDGMCLLTVSEDTVLRVFEIPSDALQEEHWSFDHGGAQVAHSHRDSSRDREWNPCLHSVEGETVYDFAWYPHMSSAEPSTCVYVSTSRDHPLHLWDAFTGNLRATYRAYDHLDEVVAANSVCFNNGGNKIFAGYNRMIRVFDVAQPGRSFEARPTCKTRKSATGQRGIISSLAFSPDPAGGGLFAAGSYARSICLYSENSRGRAVAEFSTPTMGGVTHLKFSPAGRLLFSGSRKDQEIVCWDIRRTREALHKFRRQGDTNQRIAFDVDPSGKYLATGSTAREALVYDVETPALVGNLKNQADAVGSVCFHPYAALLAVCTGQRHFELCADAGSGSDDTLDDAATDVSVKLTGGTVEQSRNAVAIYRIGKSKSATSAP